MDKRYQVFVSSPYIGLEEERQAVMQALQSAGYFVAGMELFPSADDDSWTVIQKVIDLCDYYVLVLAGRYGSVSEESSLSYTEMEYDYARSKKMPVLAFLNADRSSLPKKYSESENPTLLEEFIAKVEKNHNRSAWTNKDELATKVLAAIQQTIFSKPRVGWVRGDAAEAKEEFARRLDELQQRHERVLGERDSLSERLGKYREQDEAKSFAWGEDEVTLEIRFKSERKGEQAQAGKIGVSVTWNEIFEKIAPLLIAWRVVDEIYIQLLNFLTQRNSESSLNQSRYKLAPDLLDVVRSQFLVTSMIMVEERDHNHSQKMAANLPKSAARMYIRRTEFWKLTERGLREWSAKQAMRRPNPGSPSG